MKRTLKLTLIYALCLSVLGFTIYILYGLINRKQEVYINGIIPLKTQEELILDSELIIEGEVVQIFDSKWSNENFYRGDDISNVLQTDIGIRVDDIISGICNSKTVKVRIDKGEDKNTIVYSDGYPDFSCGEKVVLFLSRDDSDTATDEDYYVLTGMIQGKYVLLQDSKTTFSKNNTAYVNTFNGEKTINSSSLKEYANKTKEENPNYIEQKAEKQKRILAENKRNFGE